MWDILIIIFINLSGIKPVMSSDLETAIGAKIKPLLERAMQKNLGITVNEITSDISDSLLKTPLIDMVIDSKLPYKKARNSFRKWILIKMLRLNCGNISEAARKLQITRRTIHRLIRCYSIDIKGLRANLIKRDYVKKTAISSLIEDTLRHYEPTIRQKRLEDFYRDIPSLSQQILEELPDETISLKDAEMEFEKRYLQEMLKSNKNSVHKAAEKAGLRPETFYRKIKALNIAHGL